MHIKNKSNPYAEELGAMLDDCPKAIVAAIAVSALTCGGDHLQEAAERFRAEWGALHVNGIVHKGPRNA